jgi:hypothetical protein
MYNSCKMPTPRKLKCNDPTSHNHKCINDVLAWNDNPIVTRLIVI